MQTLTDLNDFITPSQACIKPVEVKKQPEQEVGLASTNIRIDSLGEYYEVSTGEVEANGQGGSAKGKKLEQAQISLNDCLACSGCITSAESVLITLQSHIEVLNILESNPPLSSPDHRIPVLSISPQTLASLSAVMSSTSTATPTSLDHILSNIRSFAKQELGFKYVFDTTFARHIALAEHVREFEQRKQGGGRLPMLASACPGWVCYAEKTHAEMLPFISTTKSPQQIMGTIAKEWLAAQLGKSPDQIYHVTVMPCYDKKLEASRQDFYNEQFRTRDVDCVITTGELELLLREKNWDLNHYRLPTYPSKHISHSLEQRIPDLIQHSGSSSGGWLNVIIDSVRIKEELQGRATYISKPKMIRNSNADYEDIIVESVDGVSGERKTVFRGAKCYGFRNLQNVVRKIGMSEGVRVGGGAAGRLAGAGAKVGGALRARRAAAAANGTAAPPAAAESKGYDYIEVMACPGGCVNGGGQARRPARLQDAEGFARDWNADGVTSSSRWDDKEWVKLVEQAYWEPAHEHRHVDADKLAEQVLDELCGGETIPAATREVRRSKALRTEYREVISDVIGLAVKW